MMLTGLYLFLAIILEVAGTTSMKFSHGFTEIGPSMLIFIFYSLSFCFLTLSLKKLDVSLAYAVWSGLGTFLIAVIGVFYFQESMTLLKAASLLFIIVGVIGLRLE